MPAAPRSNPEEEAGSWGTNPLPSEENSNKSSEKGSNWGVEPRMFTSAPVQHIADGMRCPLKAQMPETMI
jgi:hypothetical protein